MQSNIVKNWFGNEFDQLDPLMQKLHLNGGELSGDVDIFYGRGLAGLIGKRLAKKMKLPEQGIHQLVVSISHSDDGLHWDRQFNDANLVKSLFEPIGSNAQGYWLETTGPVSMKLAVDVINGGWYWRCLAVSLFSVPIPLFFIPKSNAFKVIEDGKYRFQVSFTLPLLGSLVSYKGLLEAKYHA